jgi:hypothetical protein
MHRTQIVKSESCVFILIWLVLKNVYRLIAVGGDANSGRGK